MWCLVYWRFLFSQFELLWSLFQIKSLFLKISGKTPEEKLQNTWLKLQNDVNCFIDSDLDKLSTVKSPGIKQVRFKKYEINKHIR